MSLSRRLSHHFFVAALSLLSLAFAPSGQAVETTQSGYKTPPAILQAIVDAPRPPQLHLSPRRDWIAMVQAPELPGIAEVAQPELRLAGVRIHPRTASSSRFGYGNDLWLLEVASQKEVRIKGLPSPLRLADLQWSPDQRHLAFSHVGANGVELWLFDLASKNARRLDPQYINNVHGRGFAWLPDSGSLLVRHTPTNLAAAPASQAIPGGPNVQESQPGGGKMQLRTWPDLLKNEQDSLLFEYYARVQLALLGLDGKSRNLGQPELFTAAQVSPNGQYILTQSIDRPFSYSVPASSFPKRIEIRDLSGKVLHTLGKQPLEEGLPPGDDAVSHGPRHASWRADAAATVVWAEAQDRGDPAQKVRVRDKVLALAAPFGAQVQVLAELGGRYQGILWGRGDLALLEEGWRKTRNRKLWRIAPDQSAPAPELIFDGSTEDHYHDPGRALMQTDAGGLPRLQLLAGDAILLAGEGASPEGSRPFLDSFDLASKKKQRLFQASGPVYEKVQEVLNNDATLLLTRRETPTERPNFYVRDLSKSGEAQLTALTRFPHPLPQLIGIQKEVIQYQRADGVALNATLYLPPGYQAARDGPLPLLMWAYPREFQSADTAGQVLESPFQFNAINPSSAKAMVAMGYAVLDNPSMPIVGVQGKDANDTYLAQLIASAQAAVDDVVRRGVAERHRIAIGGHSYGAFMTANLLAHTRLFRAGVARSGAYNRTLTPFGFQNEERSFWQAQPVYQAMSPFNYADKIKDAMLFVHGEQDNNPGTFPLQSERMFLAMKGLGGIARLVMLPNESHTYRARESILHMLYETNEWLEKYVKNAKPNANQ
jgi:dipeptidyl aminopeptidase/acylaminoacyl peptidase